MSLKLEALDSFGGKSDGIRRHGGRPDVRGDLRVMFSIVYGDLELQPNGQRGPR